MISDEAPRGRTPPPWYASLAGIDRVRAYSENLLPATPLGRLLGLRITHVVPGSVTAAMPAAEILLTPNGLIEIVPAMVAALESACTTALPARRVATPLTSTYDLFRPAEPEPPQAPDPLPRVEEPVYETPDPYLRQYPMPRFAGSSTNSGEGSVAEQWISERGAPSPIVEVLGLQLRRFTRSESRLEIPASEWFCSFEPTESPQIIATLADMSGWTAAMGLLHPGVSLVGNDGTVRFLRPIVADGRPITAHSRIAEHDSGVLFGESSIVDADGTVAATYTCGLQLIDTSSRAQATKKSARRVLATLLFTDIVDSTNHVERVGDAEWRQVLEKHRTAVRREFSRHNGTEADTAGDGFFMRFESPAQAIMAARSACAAVRRLGIELRAGVHTGECELEGNKPSGMAVHLAARIQAAAEPGEVLVSSTARELATGAGLRFVDRGEHQFKGVPDPWRVYALAE